MIVSVSFPFPFSLASEETFSSLNGSDGEDEAQDKEGNTVDVVQDCICFIVIEVTEVMGDSISTNGAVLM